MICKNNVCKHHDESWVNNCRLKPDTAGCESFLKEQPLTSKTDDGAEIACSGGLGAIADKEDIETNKVKEAMETLKAAFEADPDYAHSWHCNLAMAFYDAMDENCIDENCKMVWTNAGAARFMAAAFDIKTSA